MEETIQLLKHLANVTDNVYLRDKIILLEKQIELKIKQLKKD